MKLITLSGVRTRLANLRGLRTPPSGDNSDWDTYCQDAFEYAWRYFPWTFSKKVVTLDLTTDAYLPEDFDYEGWREANPISPSQRWSEVTLEDFALLNGNGSLAFALEFDFSNNRYKVVAQGSPTITIAYQVAPPQLDDSGVPFPSAQAVAMGANIWAKYGANPTSADAQQQWDMFHSYLDRLSAVADKNRPRGRAVNLQDVYGTFTGDVR